MWSFVEQCSNVAKKQEHPLSAQVATGSSKGKQINSKPTRHLQQVNSERSTEFASKEDATAMTLMSDQKSLKEKNPGGSKDLELHIPKELQPQGKRHDETKSRSRQSLVAASTEASTSRQERNSNNKVQYYCFMCFVKRKIYDAFYVIMMMILSMLQPKVEY